MKEQVGIDVRMAPGDVPPYVHSHTVCIVAGIVLPAQDEATFRKIKAAFEDGGMAETLTRAMRNAADQIVPQVVNAILHERGVVYESSLRRFISKPEAKS